MGANMEVTKGVVIVGGLGTRLKPMTNVINKHLLPVWKYPMVYYPLMALADAGVDDVIVVTGGNNPGGFLELLRDGSEFGFKQLYFAYQHAPRGIADALRCAERFVNGEPCVLMLGDNIIGGSIKEYVDNFREQEAGMRVLLKRVSDPERFGVPVISGGKITAVIEKPDDPPSDHAIIGVYMMDGNVWGILPDLPLSERNQYEITDVQNAYIERGLLEYDLLEHEWSDAGTVDSLRAASELALRCFSGTDEAMAPA